MRDYVKRMVTEAEDLSGKIKRAETAITQNPYGMDATSKDLLSKQIVPMKEYLEILNQRIKYEESK